MTTAIPASVQQVVERGLTTYDVDVAGDLTGEQTGESTYEVVVPFTGELLFDDVMENQGLLLYNKREEGEVALNGVRDGNLVVSVRID